MLQLEFGGRGLALASDVRRNRFQDCCLTIITAVIAGCQAEAPSSASALGVFQPIHQPHIQVVLTWQPATFILR